MSIPCKGPLGCSEGDKIVCDQSGNVAGDPCSAAQDGTAVCSTDGTKQLRCTSGTRTATECPGGCSTSGDTSTCALVDPNASYDVVAVSASFQTMEPNGDSWDLGGGAPDGKVCWYDDITEATATCSTEASDLFEATFNTTIKSSITASHLLDSGSNAGICLFDVDATSDDQVGCVYARFTAAQINAGETTITTSADGNNIGGASFVIRFVKR